MAPLPRCQFPSTDVPYPFANAGVDAFGPFFVVNGKRTEKHYSLIFTCLVTRACHLQPPCPALTTDSFINAFRRIIARRGQLQYIRSDNGKIFICVRRELQETLKAAIRTSSTSSCDGMAPQSIVRATLWWSVGTPYPNGQEDSTPDLGFQKTDSRTVSHNPCRNRTDAQLTNSDPSCRLPWQRRTSDSQPFSSPQTLCKRATWSFPRFQLSAHAEVLERISKTYQPYLEETANWIPSNSASTLLVEPKTTTNHCRRTFLGATRLHTSWDLAYWASGSSFPWTRWTDTSVSVRQLKEPSRAPPSLFPPFSLCDASFNTTNISNFFPVHPFLPSLLPAAWEAGACQWWPKTLTQHELKRFHLYFLTFHTCFQTFCSNCWSYWWFNKWNIRRSSHSQKIQILEI